MNTFQADALNDFDLEYLSPANNVPILKQRCITQLKRRIIRVDAIQRHWVTLNQHLSNKSKELEDTLKKLELTQQDYKQTSLEYKETLASSNNYENENQTLKATVIKLQNDYTIAVTQLEARQSHIVQLEQLVKEQEKRIEDLRNLESKKAEKLVNEKISAEIKEKDKERLLWKKKYESLRKKVKEKESKRKSNKALPKYDKDETTSDFLSLDEQSDNDDNISVEFMSQLVAQELSQNSVRMNKRRPSVSKDSIRMEMDNDCNEVVSIDTGCGSSLASSDNEKWLNSPDYMFIPIHGDNIENNHGQKLVTVATSPIVSMNIVDKATSPIPRVNMIDAGTNPITLVKMIDVATSATNQFEDMTSSPKPVITIDRAVTPIKLFKLSSVSTSPIKRFTRERATSPINVLENVTDTTHEHTIKESVTGQLNVLEDITDIDMNMKETLNNTKTNSNNSVKNAQNKANVHTLIRKSSIKENNSSSVVEDTQNSINGELQIVCDVAEPFDGNSIFDGIDRLQERREKDLLNSKSKMDIDTDVGTDSEIEMILNTMRFNRKLITPLPRTPGRTIIQSTTANSRDVLEEELTHSVCQEAAIARDHAATAREEAASAREYAAKIREEHIKLMTDFTKMMKDMTTIKSFLKCRLSMPDNTVLEDNDQLPMLNNNFSSRKTQGETAILTNNFDLGIMQDLSQIPSIENSSHQSYDQSSILDNNSSPSQLKDKSATPKNNLNSNKLQDPVDVSKIDLSQSVANPLGKKITITSDNHLKPTDLNNLKTKHDWKTLIQKSEQEAELKPCVEKPLHSPKIEDKLHNGSVKRNKFSSQDIKKKRAVKAKKITNLDRYRKKCEVRKYKIKRESPPLKPKRKLLQVCLTKIKNLNTSVKLNDENVYANAVKVMAQLKANMNKSSPKFNIDIQSDKQDKPLNTSASQEIADIQMQSATICKQLDDKSQSLPSATFESAIVSSAPKSTIITRSKKIFDQDSMSQENVVNAKVPEIENRLEPVVHKTDLSIQNNSEKSETVSEPTPIAKRKRKLTEGSDVTPKRILRNTPQINNEENNEITQKVPVICTDPKESILCAMIHKYGAKSKKHRSRNSEDPHARSVCEKIERFMSETENVACKQKRDELAEDLEKYNYKNFIDGLMMYLNNDDRKCELLSKMSAVPAQIQITKSEAVLMYVIKQLRNTWNFIDFVGHILSSIEYVLFRLNHTPNFNIVEVMSHFYAVLCRLSDDRDRLITFMLDSMYCIQFKSVVLIKQCLEAWPNIIPLAHMSKAKTPLMTCFVYLLHFFKCEDKHNRMQVLRTMMNRKYFYEITQWNEKKIFELLKSSIKELKDSKHDQKMLRIALIVFGKRHGPKWTNNNIIKNLLKPFIDQEKVPNYVKAFCVATIGPLMKPYPPEMRVHCNIAFDQLLSVLNKTNSKEIADAAMTSIMIMCRQNLDRVAEILFTHKMEVITPELEKLLRDYVRTKTLSVWLKTLPDIDSDQNKNKTKVNTV